LSVSDPDPASGAQAPGGDIPGSVLPDDALSVRSGSGPAPLATSPAVPSKPVVIAGGSGLLGVALTQSLRADGIPVVWIARHPARLRSDKGLRIVGWEDEPAWRGAVADASAVVNLCGASVAGKRWDDAYKDELVRSRIEPTEKLASAHPRVMIQGSAVGIYGDRGDEILEESASPGDDFLARLGTRWEAASEEASEAGGRVVLLRTGQVLAREGGMLPALLRPPQVPFSPWLLGLGGPLGSGLAWMPWIHVVDWVNLVRFALNRSEIAGPVNAVAPQPVRNRAFSAALGHAIHRPAILPVPAWALRKLVGEFADALLSSERVVPAAALSNGFAFRFPTIDRALADLFGGRSGAEPVAGATARVE
jgi:uncharacterized protein (TIGR01777 family)